MSKPASTKRRKFTKLNEPIDPVGPTEETMGTVKSKRKSATEAMVDVKTGDPHDIARTIVQCAEYLATSAKLLGYHGQGVLDMVAGHLAANGVPRFATPTPEQQQEAFEHKYGMDQPVGATPAAPKYSPDQVFEMMETLNTKLVRRDEKLEEMSKLIGDLYERAQRTDHKLRNHSHGRDGRAVESL